MGKNDRWYIIIAILLAVVAGSYFLSVVNPASRPFEQTIQNTVTGSDAQGVITFGPFSRGVDPSVDYYRIGKITIDGVDAVTYVWATPYLESPAPTYQTNTNLISWAYDTFTGYAHCSSAHANCEAVITAQSTTTPKTQILHFAIKAPSIGTHTVTTSLCVTTGAMSLDSTGASCPIPVRDCYTFTDTFTVTQNTGTPPIPPVLNYWNSVKTWIDGLLAWLRGLLPFAIATTSAPVNVPYSATISLSSIPATDTNGADGYVAETTCAGFIIDSTGAYKYQGTPTILANGITTYSTTVSFTPTVTGKYAQGIACITRSASYNYATQTWNSWTTPTVSASDKGDITVTGPGTPPTPPAIGDFWGNISSLISGFICWLTELLGGTCS